jgi:hypothetical protein
MCTESLTWIPNKTLHELSRGDLVGVIGCTLSMSGCRKDGAVVILDNFQPSCDIRGVFFPWLLEGSGFESVADGKRMAALKRHSESGMYVGALGNGTRELSAKRLTAGSWRNVANGWTKGPKTQEYSSFSKRNGR